MKYYVRHGGQQSGPYSLSDLQSMSAQGRLESYDVAWSEELPVWTPIFMVLGNAQAPLSPSAGAPPYPAGEAGRPTAPAASGQAGPIPPAIHWGLVLLLSMVTLGIFGWIWLLMESSFVRKIDPRSPGTLLWSIVLVVYLVGVSMIFGGSANGDEEVVAFGCLLLLPAIVLFQVGNFSIKKSLETYYNSSENIGLRLGGAMTFFFSILYFQHHFRRIAEWKRTGRLVPQ